MIVARSSSLSAPLKEDSPGHEAPPPDAERRFPKADSDLQSEGKVAVPRIIDFLEKCIAMMASDETLDLLRDQSDPKKFIFYESYVDADAVTFHKTTDHYKAWANFKAEGGVVSQTVIKADGLDFQ